MYLLLEKWQDVFAYYSSIRKIVTDTILYFYYVFCLFLAVLLVVYRKASVKILFLITLFFLFAVSIWAGLNNTILVYNARFCSNYEGNVQYALNYSLDESAFFYFVECSIEAIKNDDPFLKTTNMIQQSLKEPNITQARRDELNLILDSISRLRCNATVNVTFENSTGTYVAQTSYNTLYHLEYKTLCIRTIIDFGIIQIIFILTLVIGCFLLVLLGVPLPDERVDTENEARDVNFHTLNSPLENGNIESVLTFENFNR